MSEIHHTAIVFPRPPPTCNTLTPEERAKLLRSTAKLGQLLGSTPHVVDEIIDRKSTPLPYDLRCATFTDSHFQCRSTNPCLYLRSQRNLGSRDMVELRLGMRAPTGRRSESIHRTLFLLLIREQAHRRQGHHYRSVLRLRPLRRTLRQKRDGEFGLREADLPYYGWVSANPINSHHTQHHHPLIQIRVTPTLKLLLHRVSLSVLMPLSRERRCAA